MRAAILYRTADVDSSPLSLGEIDDPEPDEGDVRVRVRACGVCRTDLHVIEGDLPETKRPLIPGHMVVGEVDRVGDGVATLSVGNLVGIAWLRGTDGTCGFCTSGRENLCAASRYTGYHEHGGYAEYAVVPADFAYALPDSLDAVRGAPLLCSGLIGYRALERAEVPERGRLLLVGFGSSAHIVLQLALHRGHDVYVVTRSANHIEHARETGAAWAGDDFGRLPEPVDSAILFAPSGGLVPPIMESLAHGGTLSIAGIHLSDVPELTYETHLFHEKQIRSVAANTREDGRRLLEEAIAAGLRPDVVEYDLGDANRALQDLKHSRTTGTGVLAIG